MAIKAFIAAQYVVDLVAMNFNRLYQNLKAVDMEGRRARVPADF
jgi:hypothetical protein